MIIIYLVSQVLCPAESTVYMKISQDMYSKPLYHAMEGVSYMGHPVVSGSMSAVLFVAEEYPASRQSYMGLFCNCATVIPLKYIVNRQRPSGEHSRWDASFPSGHTTFIFTQAYILSHNYPKATIPLFTFATVVGFSRIYLKKHYPSDVLTGAVLGIVTGLIATKLID